MPKQRIQRILAAAGVGSRRACEELVTAGRVSVNGQVVRELPLLIDPQRDRCTVDGKPVRVEEHTYLLLNKPHELVCDFRGPPGRKCLADIFRDTQRRLVPIGKLETEAGGLVLLTSDTAMASALSRRGAMPDRVYRVQVRGCPDEAALRRIREGLWLSDGRVRPERADMVHRQRDQATLDITIRGGGHREIPRLLSKVGHKVSRMTCLEMGRLSVLKLPAGAIRPLTPAEVDFLQKQADAAPRHVDRRDFAPRSRPGRSASRGSVRSAPPHRGYNAPDRGRRPTTPRPQRVDEAPPAAIKAVQPPAGQETFAPNELHRALLPHAPKRRIILPASRPRPPKRRKK